MSKKAVVNIQNKDDLCFLWAVIAGKYGDPEDGNPQRVAHYWQWEHEFNIASYRNADGAQGHPQIRANE